MEFWFVDGILGREAEVENIHQGLENGGSDGRAARGTGDEIDLSLVEHKGWGHGAEHAFARGDGIGLVADGAIHIGDTRFDTEVVHFIVEKEPCAAYDHFAALAAVRGMVDGNWV